MNTCLLSIFLTVVPMQGSFLTPLEEGKDSVLIADQMLYGVEIKDVPEGTRLFFPEIRQENQYSQMLSWYSFYWPIIVLLMIPVFAFMLKLLFRKDKKVYMHHLVFALHIHSVLLLLLAIGIVWTLWVKYHTMDMWNILGIYFLLYTTWAVRRVYVRNHWIKAAIKTLLLYAGYLLVLGAVFIYTLWWVTENVIS